MTGGFTDQQRARIVRRTPLRRLGTVADIVRPVRFLDLARRPRSSPDRLIAVDGGFTC